MGAHASSFMNDGSSEVAKYKTHPKKSDWIVVHAVASGLAIVEVERLWIRFQQLGCNEDGVIEMEALSRPPASNDIFTKNIMLNLFGSNDTIEFRTFLNMMIWAERADLDDKIKAAFNLLNLGNPVSKTILHQVLRKTYPENTFEEVGRMADSLMNEIDLKKQGSFDQDQFRRWVRQLPQDEVEELFQFAIVPPDIRRWHANNQS